MSSLAGLLLQRLCQRVCFARCTRVERARRARASVARASADEGARKFANAARDARANLVQGDALSGALHRCSARVRGAG
ncbi:hypothetical protein PSP6_530034 [Paraburkholderia tropica]|nr:hypothetical protein PSP6_530034 [Paraburkholderia tropica]